VQEISLRRRPYACKRCSAAPKDAPMVPPADPPPECAKRLREASRSVGAVPKRGRAAKAPAKAPAKAQGVRAAAVHAQTLLSLV
jgi:hypothetical protein